MKKASLAQQLLLVGGRDRIRLHQLVRPVHVPLIHRPSSRPDNRPRVAVHVLNRWGFFEHPLPLGKPTVDIGALPPSGSLPSHDARFLAARFLALLKRISQCYLVLFA